MLEIIIHEFLAPGFAAVLTGAVGYIVWNLKEQRKEQKAAAEAQADASEAQAKKLDAIERGLMLELRRDILEDHVRYCINGEEMQPLAYENLCEVHDAYKTLGGNGMTDKAFEEIADVHLSKGGLV